MRKIGDIVKIKSNYGTACDGMEGEIISFSDDGKQATILFKKWNGEKVGQVELPIDSFK